MNSDCSLLTIRRTQPICQSADYILQNNRSEFALLSIGGGGMCSVDPRHVKWMLPLQPIYLSSWRDWFQCRRGFQRNQLRKLCADVARCWPVSVLSNWMCSVQQTPCCHDYVAGADMKVFSILESDLNWSSNADNLLRSLISNLRQ